METLRQIFAVSLLNFRGLPTRLWSSLVIVVGMACVVAVLLSMLSFSTGLRRMVLSAADPGRAIVVTKGAVNEFGQLIKRDGVATIAGEPGVAKDTDGKPIVSGEHLTNVPIKRKSDSILTNVVLRGIGAKGILLRPTFHLLSGRMFQPGKNELIVGIGASENFAGLNVGDMVRLPTGVWTVVGIFTTGGDLIESQMLGDVDTVNAAVKRNGYGSVIVRLESPDAFDRFKAALLMNPALDVDIERQSDFYARTVGQLGIFLATLAYVIGGIMAVGALFGTVNIMYSAVSTRVREIATLRALGFGAAPVAISVVAETLLLAILGGMIGAFLAWVLFNGAHESAHPGPAAESEFLLAVTPGLVVIGLSWAVVIALLGGLFPAIRAARVPVATALRRS